MSKKISTTTAFHRLKAMWEMLGDIDESLHYSNVPPVDREKLKDHMEKAQQHLDSAVCILDPGDHPGKIMRPK